MSTLRIVEQMADYFQHEQRRTYDPVGDALRNIEVALAGLKALQQRDPRSVTGRFNALQSVHTEFTQLLIDMGEGR